MDLDSVPPQILRNRLRPIHQSHESKVELRFTYCNVGFYFANNGNTPGFRSMVSLTRSLVELVMRPCTTTWYLVNILRICKYIVKQPVQCLISPSLEVMGICKRKVTQEEAERIDMQSPDRKRKIDLVDHVPRSMARCSSTFLQLQFRRTRPPSNCIVDARAERNMPRKRSPTNKRGGTKYV